jgi:hypothetical protein
MRGFVDGIIRDPELFGSRRRRNSLGTGDASGARCRHRAMAGAYPLARCRLRRSRVPIPGYWRGSRERNRCKGDGTRGDGARCTVEEAHGPYSTEIDPRKLIMNDTSAPHKSKPRTEAGFGCRSSWLSHAWCGPLRAGRRGYGYGVTVVNLRTHVAHYKTLLAEVRVRTSLPIDTRQQSVDSSNL